MLSMGIPLVWLGCGIKWVTVCEVTKAWNMMMREKEEEGQVGGEGFCTLPDAMIFLQDA